MAADWLNPSVIVKEKEKLTDEKDELFVFGYACKLFRDDEKALSIDRESHLIPWMGDDKLLIDRYDGRGHLYDLKPYDSSHAKPCQLSTEEKKLEELCDEERYLELHTDVAEKKLYEEEEWKRYYQSLSEGYGAVGFTYEYPQQEEYADYYQAVSEEEKPFTVPQELNLPSDITPPDTEKANAIIEKTAKFVAKQGAQMEILIKTKQANNPQFDFLHFENPLNLYYKHMVKMIKSGKYKPKEAADTEDEDEDDDDGHGHGYLHPSLMTTRKASPAPEVPAYKLVEMPKVSVHDTPYGQLIKSLVKKQPELNQSVSQVPDYQEDVKPLKPPPLPPFYQDSVYSGGHHAHPPPPGIEPVTLPTHLQTEPPPPGTDIEDPILPHSQTQVIMDQSQSHSRASPGPFDHIVPPPPDIQPVIDRMAMYVAKNGIEFEIVVKSKNDPRFQFLLPHHVHFPYYDFKKQIHMREAAKDREKKDVEKPTKLSFSIKPKVKEKENKHKEKRKKKVFDNESSDNDADSDREKSSASGTSTPVSSEYMEEKVEKPPIPQEERDRRIAEERLKDKLAHAAREKLVQTSREKQMQAERKRKAAMFINMLRSCNAGGAGDEEKMDEELPSAKVSEKSTPVPTPGCSPYYGPLEKSKSEDVDPKRPKKSRHKDRSSRRSRSKSPKKRKKSRSCSPQRKQNKSRSQSPSSSQQRSRSPSSRGSHRDRHSSSKKSKKKRKSRASSRSPKPKQKPEMPVSIDLTVDESPELPSISNGEDSSYSIWQYNVDSNQKVTEQGEVSSDRLTPSLETEDSNSNYMRERVRAIIKASRKAIMEEEGPLYDDT
ncbi:splicing factor, suppressor of white-apricot homolog isoform X2 [Ostrea edulis]|uniref:splicing factor, suppressor of white-apricot homolog isoform X2 n=1 Tax=Ostrea edulis TaxID=37623 RepID=UPI0024AF01C5|nr:splicing factor, suppressor of white-apricot homolog isoform X2 [Ostrea edulis]